ncbi:MAG: hypothetical protein LBK03_03445 [Bacteroidales bacterium]|jgi:hypothetical protein|nr:hypothetical protein [Bacteroidales bacterium]
MKRFLAKYIIITLLVTVSTVSFGRDYVQQIAIIPNSETLSNAPSPMEAVHHPELTVSNILSLNVEKPTAFAGQTVMPLRLISSFTLLKELFLQQQIHHKLSILNALSDCYLAQKILHGYYTLGLGIMRC